MNRLPAIDGLRAIAVLSVVAYHAGLPIPAGFVGVDVFFVISGYLITRLLADEHRASGRIDFLHFYARRVRRILPAMVVVVAAVLLASRLLGPADQVSVARSAVASLAMVANLHFMGQTGGYFDASADEMPLLHLWSLGVEEQFYLLWPILLVVLLRRGRGVVPLAVLAVASLGLAEWLLRINPEAAFYQMPARFWELAVGGLVALRPMRLPRLTAPLGLLVVLVSPLLPMLHFPGFGALPAVLGSAAVIAAVHNGARVPILEARPVVWVGLLSYSLYLWHWPLLAFNEVLNPGSGVGERVALCGLALLLAWASYALVENPLRRWKPKLPRPAVVGGGVAALLVGMVGASSLQARAVAAIPPVKPFPRCIVFAESTTAELPPPVCQSQAGEPRVVVWGDSHADAWRQFAFTRWAAEPVAAYTFSACPPVLDHDRAHPQYPQQAALCRAFNAKALAAIKAGGAHTVVLAARWDAYDGLGGLRRTVEALGNVRVLAMAPTPVLHGDATRCLEAGKPQACALTRTEYEQASKGAREALAGLAADFPNVEVVDPADYLCDAERCPIQRGGVALYRDDNHITPEAAAGFAGVYAQP